MSQSHKVRYPINALRVIDTKSGAWKAFISLFVFLLMSTVCSAYTFMTYTPPGGSCTAKVSLNEVEVLDTPRSPKADKIEALARKVSVRYQVDFIRAKEIVAMAEANEDKVFPKAADILAVIAIESKFDPTAKNAGAFGLMQIQYGHHKARFQSKTDLMDPLYNIRAGTAILHEYNVALRGNKEATILAYQAGIGGYLTGDTKQDYLQKYQREFAWFKTVIT